MDVKEQLKDQVKITEVADRLGLDLEKNGKAWQGNCPTGHPSQSGKCFAINIEENYFYCFNCGTGGDIFTLVEITEGLDFKEALKWTAENFKPDLLPELEKQKENLSPAAREKYQKAALFDLIFEYGRELLFKPEGAEALEYLMVDRGLTRELVENTEWIYWPPEQKIRKYLQEKQPEAQGEILRLQLAGGLGDNFRLAAPYRDRRGIITGFVKRATKPEGIEVNGKLARWDSTAGTSKEDLFNLHKAKNNKELILVEGIPEAINLPAAGKKKIVAISQGALSKKHLEGLKWAGCKRLVICFDNDQAGPENTERAVNILLNERDIKPFVVEPSQLGQYKDLDELVTAEGPETFKDLVNKAENGAKWLTKKLLAKHDLATDKGQEAALEEALELEGRQLDPLDSKAIIETLAGALEVELEFLEPRLLEYHEKKAKEKQEKELQQLFNQGRALLKEGQLQQARELLQEKSRQLEATAASYKLTPYGTKELLQDIAETPEGLATGWPSLDSYITLPQEAITILAGRPSHGKTTLLLNLLLNLTENYPEQTFYLFSYEETRKQIALKLINILAGDLVNEQQNLKQIEGYLRGNNTTRPKIEQAKEKLQDLAESGRLVIVDQPLFVDELAGTVKQLANKENVGAVLIDYMQKVKTSGTYGTRQLELQAISEQLLETAKEAALPIVLGAQLGREKSSQNKVKLDNLREAGDIEQDANLVLGLQNPAMEQAQEEGEKLAAREVELNLTILKNRAGTVNQEVALEFDRPLMQIREKKRGAFE